jgi:hypothetical protein
MRMLQSKCLRIATYARWYVVTGKLRRVWGSIFRRPHWSTDWETGLRVSWCGEFLSSATWKALVPTEGWLKSHAGKHGELMLSSPVEALPQKDSQVGATNCLTARRPWLRCSVLFLSYKENAKIQFKRGTARLPQSWRPSAKAIPTLLGSTPRKPSNQNPFHKGQVW